MMKDGTDFFTESAETTNAASADFHLLIINTHHVWVSGSKLVKMWVLKLFVVVQLGLTIFLQRFQLCYHN